MVHSPPPRQPVGLSLEGAELPGAPGHGSASPSKRHRNVRRAGGDGPLSPGRLRLAAQNGHSGSHASATSPLVSPQSPGRMQRMTRECFRDGASPPVSSPPPPPKPRVMQPQAPGPRPPRMSNIGGVFTSRPSSNLDVAEGNEVAEDPFQTIMADLLSEHRRQVNDLFSENAELRDRLTAVLSSTWKFGSEKWHGQPQDPSAGSLQLTCNSGKKEKSSWKHDVAEEEIDRQMVDKEVHFKSKDAWKPLSEFEMETIALVDRKHRNESVESEGRRNSLVSEGMAELLQARSACCGRMISSPTSAHRLLWDLLGMIMLAYDIVMIPISFFNPAPNIVTSSMEWTTLIFWTLDMPASLLTGYISKGATVMHPRKIFWNYLRTWFLLDCLVQIPDWVVTIMNLMTVQEEGSGGGTNVSGLLRIIRAVRVLRLLRVAKLKKYLQEVKDRIESESVFAFVAVVQLSLSIVVVNHFLGSCWYFIGDLTQSLSMRSWIERYKIADEPLSFRYTSSVYFSLTSFALSSSTLDAQNSIERVYLIFLTIVGMMTFSFFVSKVTLSLIALQNIHGETSKQFWLLRRYLRQHHVSNSLKLKVIRFLEYKAATRQETVPESRLTLLNMLSDNLRSDLTYQVSFVNLSRHPLVGFAEGISGKIVKGLVGRVLSLKTFSEDDVIFQRGTLTSFMYYVTSGVWTHSKTSSITKTTLITDVEVDDWLCEQALWVSWACRGDCIAATDSSLILIDVWAFAEAMQESQAMWACMCSYAEVFIENLNGLDHSEHTDVFSVDASEKAEEFLKAAKLRRQHHREESEEAEEVEKEPTKRISALSDAEPCA
eukprot:TRINITY_DN19309_c0_g1_i1.p1 TRINITY_DN19309_c0_g1~~TRINITY_DN19309_c0_g1_i1.p1  ORF type:complete len:827 (-),score=113.19 TRINITY_DN19309_c0_g1_i1:298-2778(-)